MCRTTQWESSRAWLLKMCKDDLPLPSRKLHYDPAAILVTAGLVDEWLSQVPHQTPALTRDLHLRLLP